MVKKLLNRNSPDKINWFWNLTTKWWFFPLFWFLLAFLYGVLFSADDLFYYNLDVPWILFNIFGIFMNVPLGISYLILMIINLIFEVGFDFLSLLIILLTQAIFYVYFIVSILKIIKAKNNENKILKKCIVILFLLILLGFIGIFLSRRYSIDFGLGPPLFGA